MLASLFSGSCSAPGLGQSFVAAEATFSLHVSVRRPKLECRFQLCVEEPVNLFSNIIVSFLHLYNGIVIVYILRDKKMLLEEKLAVST